MRSDTRPQNGALMSCTTANVTTSNDTTVPSPLMPNVPSTRDTTPVPCMSLA